VSWVHPAALLISGTVGSGKTTVAGQVGELLTKAQVAHAIVDLDELRRAWPAPPDDRFNLALCLRNLTAVSRTYRAAGATRLVLAGVVESRAERRRYEQAVAVPLRLARLEVDLAVVRSRLARRHEGDPAGLRWHLDRSGELDAILRAAQVEDAAVPASHGTPEQVAAAVLAAVGW
jgi:adenylylsulfate kinase